MTDPTSSPTTPEPTSASGQSLSVVIPVYNSEATIGTLVDHAIEHLAPHFHSLQIVLVNDGSKDGSHEAALAAQQRHPDHVRYVRLARNFGEHNAVLCGLHYTTGDYVAIIDDDFQNPPEEILRLTERLGEGFDVVYGIYEEKQHNWFRNLGSRFNGWLAGLLLQKPRGLYLSSFKVMNRFLVREITAYDGPYPYIDGLILRTTSAIGQQVCKHQPRAVGESNYTLSRLVRLWLNMSTNFSIFPLRIASILGIATSLLGFSLAIFFIISRFTGGILMKSQIPPGWASLIVTMTIFAGLQMALLAVIGEYLGRNYLTQNRTPQYVVRDTFGV